MSRIQIPAVDQAPTASQPLLAAVQQQLGVTPNLMKLVALSPAALEGYLSLNGALAKSSLSVALRERIALAIAEFNQCDYCLSAHSYLGEHVARIPAAEITAARQHESSDAKLSAALQFAYRVAADHGRVSDAELAALRQAGFDDASVIEIVVVVALNILTNYVNNVARTTIDFPQVRAGVLA
ncbi:carboxymuconolactone decarboxylase family protein [Leeia oryzae]|uniref:carboxymuconolactone decarboxylase family protein n=1 Tax=Leeia oryzae TaxID=356662 RepID=UPI00036A4E76|nr:carboxymuconolactone decarboxylase family protein [Leeia oryzae]